MERNPFLKAMDVTATRASDPRGAGLYAAPLAPGGGRETPGDLVALALGILGESPAPTGDAQRGELLLQRPVLSDGTECPLPIRYFDVQCLVATFLADLERGAELLAGTGLQPVAQEDGKAVVLLYCIEYRKTDIGPYNEVGLTILSRAPADPVPAIYVSDLPVTTAAANRAGREIWGYNKFVALIDVKSDGNRFSTVLRDCDNVLIGAFEGQRGPTIPAPPADILTFTRLHGKLMKTRIQVLTPAQAGSGEGLAFRVGTSKHPMTSRLRNLGLDGARPLLAHYADPFQALLFPGRAL